LLVWGFVVSTVLLLHATLCINSLAHHYGSRDFDTEDHSRNNLFLSSLPWAKAGTTITIIMPAVPGRVFTGGRLM
jgi:Fatty-acid desaturase